MVEHQGVGIPACAAALLLTGASLACLVREVWISGGALRILLSAMEEREKEP